MVHIENFTLKLDICSVQFMVYYGFAHATPNKADVENNCAYY